MTKFYFIRHTSVAVPRGICYGNTDVALADTFEQEAVKTRSQLEGIVFDCVFTSPLTRASRLAAFCGYPDAVPDPRLKEINFGDWELCSYDDLYQNDPRFKRWCDDTYFTRTPNGESVSDQMERLVSFIHDVQKINVANVAVFCHGGIQALAMVHAGIYSFDEVFSHVPEYGSVKIIEI